jgi:isoprenylcysteine carboxyl methyltransferase (ICMT) family protein YpbQ
MTDVIKIGIICSVWTLVWIFGYVGGPRIQTLSVHPQLYRYSGLVLTMITLFYTVSYIKITSINLSLSTNLQYGLLLLIVSSGYLLIVTRLALSTLSYHDILFAKNPTYTKNGPYRYMQHPMYIGISLILGSSFLLFPTALGGMLLLLCAWLFKQKSTTE